MKPIAIGFEVIKLVLLSLLFIQFHEIFFTSLFDIPCSIFIIQIFIGSGSPMFWYRGWVLGFQHDWIIVHRHSYIVNSFRV